MPGPLLPDPGDPVWIERRVTTQQDEILDLGLRDEADDRAGLERLCRYLTRPPLAAGRLQIVDDDRLTFRLKTP